MTLHYKNVLKYIVFALGVLYSLQGYAYPSDTIYSKIAIFFIMVIGIVLLLSHINFINRPIFKPLYLLILLNVIYYGFFTVTTPEMAFHQLKYVLYTLLFFIIAFYLALNNCISTKDLLVFFCIFYIVAIFKFYTEGRIINSLGMDVWTRNSGYFFAHLLPFLYLIKRKYISTVLLFLSLAFILVAAKRGAIVISVVFAGFFLFQTFLKSGNKVSPQNIMLFVFIIALVSFFIFNIYSANEYLQYRVGLTLSGDTNGREYGQIFGAWLNSDNILSYIFGLGFCASVSITNSFAHNDWLELLSMAGLLGVIIYFMFFVQVYLFSKKANMPIRDKNILQSILIIWLLKTIFSMGYNDDGMIPIVILLGFIVGKYYYDSRVNSKYVR